KENNLYQKFPKLEALARSIMEKEMIKYQEMLMLYITDSPEQRYTKLLKNRPELLQRVPQHQIASYIGIKPESLSRIRKRILKK
ncbi:MAG: Crp/Fnr family transcriptional regulator, partial [Bacteroidetes bacterium]|nr:Crp/Fnr family transcriptional regulator [Bacteroidota bacterium]